MYLHTVKIFCSTEAFQTVLAMKDVTVLKVPNDIRGHSDVQLRYQYSQAAQSIKINSCKKEEMNGSDRNRWSH